jgi:hypothetical protein
VVLADILTNYWGSIKKIEYLLAKSFVPCLLGLRVFTHRRLAKSFVPVWWACVFSRTGAWQKQIITIDNAKDKNQGAAEKMIFTFFSFLSTKERGRKPL